MAKLRGHLVLRRVHVDGRRNHQGALCGRIGHDCQVIIDQQYDEVGIEVVDDGRGGAGEGTGYGITGMRERADLLHGHLTAGPRPEGGFRVAARLPLPVPAGV